jgi:lantibiotic modifying enzyme
MGLFGGLAELAYLSEALYYVTGNYYRLFEQLNKRLEDDMVTYCEKCEKALPDVNWRHYDVINGLSGILYFVLESKWPYKKESIEPLIHYLIELSKDNDYCGLRVPNWHIKYDNQTQSGKERCIDGHFNFGLAHGIAGPLLALAKSFSCGYRHPGQMEAIENYIHYYQQYSKEIRGIIYWPGVMHFHHFIERTDDDYVGVASWCYGMLSISRVLQLTAQYMHNSELEKSAENNIVEISKATNPSPSTFTSPIVCHGYAGTLITLNAINRDLKNSDVDKCIDMSLQKLLSFFDESEHGLFKGLEVHGGIIEGTSGIIMSLISALTGRTSLERHLFLS